jgi:hypothetical protein
MTGMGRTIWRHDSAVGLEQVGLGPRVDRSEVTSSSRMASSGGLVTWANSWVK